VSRIVKAPLDHLSPGCDKDVKYFAVLWADASGINQRQVPYVLGTHHRHLGGNPAADAEADDVHGCERLLLEEPVIEHGLMWNGFHPCRTGRLPIARMGRGIHRRLLC
jgi:hypothetical protein